MDLVIGHKIEADTQVSNDLSMINNWFTSNRLTLNISNTKCMTVGTRTLLASRMPDISIAIDDNPFEKVNVYKYLGVLIDQHLYWSDHIN